MKIGFFRKRHPPVGAQPGTLVIEPGAQATDIRVMDYTAETLAEHDHVPVNRLTSHLGGGATTWIDVRGLANEATLRAIADVLHMHPLALEDVVNAPLRPKAEAYADHLLVILRMAMVEEADVRLEQVSILIGKDYVVTFQERDGDVFDPVRDRLRQNRGVIRKSGAGYLGYALIDTVIDAYYPVFEHIGEDMAELEEEVVERASRPTLRRIYAARRRLLRLRRAVWPHRDAVNSLLREDTPFLDANARLYLRDTYDHAVQLMDVLETYRETVAGLLDVFLSSESNRTNEVMRTLTVMASIFIPLTFIAGVYGMNFEGMPELRSQVGYPVVLVVMIVTAAALLWRFRRLGWIGRADASDVDGVT